MLHAETSQHWDRGRDGGAASSEWLEPAEHRDGRREPRLRAEKAGRGQTVQNTEHHTEDHASGWWGPHFSKKERFPEMSTWLRSGEWIAAGVWLGQSYVSKPLPSCRCQAMASWARVMNLGRQSGRDLTGG